jgi:hypothetical protein
LRVGALTLGIGAPAAIMPANECFADEVTGVACTSYSGFRIKVGVGSIGVRLPKAKQFMFKMRVGESREEAVARHHEKIMKLLAGDDGNCDGHARTGPACCTRTRIVRALRRCRESPERMPCT